MKKITLFMRIVCVLSSLLCVFSSTNAESSPLDYHILCHKIIHPHFNMSQDVETSLCTHIVYMFPIHINRLTLEPEVADSTRKFEKHLFQRISEHQKNAVKVSVTVDLGVNTMAFILRSVVNRQRFTDNLISFVEKFHLDGLNLVWNPATLRFFPEEELTGLIEAVSAELRRKNQFLSALAIYDQRFNYFTTALEYFDWITPLVVHQVSGKTGEWKRFGRFVIEKGIFH